MSQLAEAAREAGAPENEAPFLRVEHGSPTEGELAALVAVFAGAAAAAAAQPRHDPRPREMWGNPVDNLRHNPPLPPGAFVNQRHWQ
ncbi:acyl-CoA carboxylase epsilon subunit [Hoyosella sp. YIM 151337]|uniref:acyl-CoA carboxylase epsilon subunit n=1 Tax=Hoyosella sp. YIM 151337 TaxID=2992742 RepID=UPI0022358F82|nr:acyl-CoA carboxylase epsilon subunit [Hoyosella sp. YIM 151337]MCW4352339.1 acyl-CoA carboxylase epsilon subunit [Hoyosella sp. YIM 151337]